MTRTRRAETTPDWSLTARSHDETRAATSTLPKRRVLGAVARRGLPGIIEASLIPSAIFVTTTTLFDATIAMVAVLVWGFSTILRRAVMGQRIPSLLVLAMFGLTFKTCVGVVSGSTFAYFAQPIATTLAVGAAFVASVLLRRPVVARIAHDFCPIPPDVASRPAVLRLFTGLTLLWAGVQLFNAGATLGMLLSMPTTLFAIIRPAASLLTSAAAVTITVWWALRTARREQLVFAKV